MKNSSLLILLFCLPIFFSCGSMKVYVNNESTYSRSNPITIDNTEDESGAVGELHYLLQSNGYKLMSLSAAKKAINYDSSRTDSTYHGELTHTTTVKSAYVLKMHYSYRNDDIGYVFASFSATITDLRTGEIVMTSNFRGYRTVKRVLADFVKEMNKVIR